MTFQRKVIAPRATMVQPKVSRRRGGEKDVNSDRNDYVTNVTNGDHILSITTHCLY